MKRGGGRRYYRPDDVELLQGIQHLLYAEGYTIKGVQRILKEQGIRYVSAIGTGQIAMSAEPAPNEKTAVPVSQLVARTEPNMATPHDDRALLQSALSELLECKRLLDQVR